MRDRLEKFTKISIKVLALIVAFMVLIRFTHVFYDLVMNPFNAPIDISKGLLKHIMLSLILVELFALTLQLGLRETADPNLLLITVLTALGRDIIILDVQEVEYTKIVALTLMFAVTMMGLYFFKKQGK